MRGHTYSSVPPSRVVLLMAASLAFQVVSQTTVSNPQAQVFGCDALSCNNRGLCSTGGTIAGVGIAPQVLSIPGSSSNLSLSLVDDPRDAGILAFPGYDFLTHGQQLLVGAPSDLDVRNQPPACALLFQNQGQTFPFLTDDRYPNTTLCGENFGGLTGSDLNLLASFVRDFDATGGDSTSVNQTSSSQIPRCSQLASYITYRLRERSAFLRVYYTSVITITGGTLLGPDANTTQCTPSILTDTCRPVLPSSYQLYNVLSAQQVLHPPAATDTGFGGRNGTTPVLTVVYGSNGTPEMDLFCMHQYAPGNRALPHQALTFTSASSRAVPSWVWSMPLIIAGALALHL